MNKALYAAALGLGLAAIGWMAVTFAGTNFLGLVITLVIGAGFLLGMVELRNYRQATGTLASALAIPPPPNDETALEHWLAKLDGSLVNAVRLRLRGERVAMPSPVFTPYLVGLLVMLGLLGTFFGMVSTLQGAVVALEGTTELEAIRQGLAAPIKGLGLAFGTSVAGVAASAMLGLASVLSRRDRMLAARSLDRLGATSLLGYSLASRQEQTFQALQAQSAALPDVAQQLAALVTNLEGMTQRAENSLLENQTNFHSSTRDSYNELANSVGQSLQESMSNSGREAGQAAGVAVREALGGLREEVTDIHAELAKQVRDQLNALASGLSTSAENIGGQLGQAAIAQQEASAAQVQRSEAAFEAIAHRVDIGTGTMLERFASVSSEWLEHQAVQATERQAELAQTMNRQQEQSITNLQAGMETLINDFKDAAARNSETTRTEAQRVAQLLSATESLAAQRLESERSWLDSHQQRMTELAVVLKSELSALLEQQKQQAAATSTALQRLQEQSSTSLATLQLTTAEQLEQMQSSAKEGLSMLRNSSEEQLIALQTSAAEHLAALGSELEQPMTRLIETASETPRVAAEVIEQLRGELSKSIERDNQLLDERQRILGELGTLGESLEQSARASSSSVEKLVDATAFTLQEVGDRFSAEISSEMAQMSDVANHFAAGAAEMASLGEAFATAVTRLDESNVDLVENLARVEAMLEKAGTRSDEQMTYYVAQARELIDHSMLSQKDIIEELRQMSQRQDLFSGDRA